MIVVALRVNSLDLERLERRIVRAEFDESPGEIEYRLGHPHRP